MKFNRFFILAALFSLAFSFSSCDDDEPTAQGDENILRLDGDNVTAPRFFGGETHEAAVRFSSLLTADFQGRSLESVQVYVLDPPENMRINVYGPGTVNSPGNVLHTQEVSNAQGAGGFWTIPLTSSVNIDGNDLWIGVEVSRTTDGFIIGCDPGPAVNGGDWYSNNGGIWNTFRNYTNQAVDINWNIRGVVSEN